MHLEYIQKRMQGLRGMLSLSKRHCFFPHNASETHLFDLPKADELRLKCILSIVPEYYYPKVYLCIAHFMENIYGFLFTVEHKIIYFGECWYCNHGIHWLMASTGYCQLSGYQHSLKLK